MLCVVSCAVLCCRCAVCCHVVGGDGGGWWVGIIVVMCVVSCAVLCCRCCYCDELAPFCVVVPAAVVLSSPGPRFCFVVVEVWYCIGAIEGGVDSVLLFRSPARSHNRSHNHP